MTKSLVIHLGDRKTGSTSIQEALYLKNWKCEDVSMIYPTLGRSNSNGLANTLISPDDSKRREKQFSTLSRRIAKSDADVAVISAEKFEVVDPVELKKAIVKHFPEHVDTVRLISYVRPHVDKLVSSYAERIKQGKYFGPLNEFSAQVVKNGRYVYYDRFSKYREVFGDQFVLRPMIRDQLTKSCVVHDFFDFALSGVPFELTMSPDSNSSLCLEDLAMLRELNLAIKENDAINSNKIAITWNFAQILIQMPRTKRSKLRAERMMIPALIETYKDDAKRVDEAFFDGTPLSDALAGAYEKATETPVSVLAEDHFSEDELRNIKVWVTLVQKMYSNSPNSWAKHFKELNFPAQKNQKRSSLLDILQ